MRVCAVNGMNVAAKLEHIAAADTVFFLGEHHDRTSLRRLVGQRGELRRISQLLFGGTAHRTESGGLPVAERNSAGLVEQQRVDIAGRFDSASRHCQHIEAHQAIHAGDADSR